MRSLVQRIACLALIITPRIGRRQSGKVNRAVISCAEMLVPPAVLPVSVSEQTAAALAPLVGTEGGPRAAGGGRALVGDFAETGGDS